MANTMKLYGRINGLKAYNHKEERQDMGPVGYGDKDFCLDNTQPMKG